MPAGLGGARGANESALSPGPRRVIGLSGSLLAAGLGLVAIGPSDFGMLLALAALIALIYGVHAFGRLGPDEPREPEAPEASRSKPPRVARRRRA